MSEWGFDTDNTSNRNNSGQSTMEPEPLPRGAGVGGVSRLEAMRAQLQQRQMQEKEQKLLQMLDSQQQRAMKKGNLSGIVPPKYTNGNGPPSSNWTTNVSKNTSSYGGPSRASPSPMTGSIGGAGKVRQMFEDRRKGGVAIGPPSTTSGGYASRNLTGIDKSYPLDPLDPKATMSRSGSSKSDPPSHSYARGRAPALKPPQPPIHQQPRSKPLPTPPLMTASSGGSKRGISLERSSSRSGSGGSTASTMTTPTTPSPVGKAPEFGLIGIRRSSSGFGLGSAGRGRDENANDLASPFPIVPKTTKYREYAEDLESRESALGAKLKQMSLHPTPPSPSKSSKAPVPSTLITKTNSKDAIHGKATPKTLSKPAAGTLSPTKRSAPPPGLEECHICHRFFASDRISKHELICKKTTTKKRKVFDPTKMRMEGTEAEPYLRQVSAKASKKAPAAVPKKADWRKKHEEFVNTIRAAKVYTQHVAAGGNPADLPPPPPADTSDYVQCPHCGRKFNSGAAERHIPKCQNIKSNKRR